MVCTVAGKDPHLGLGRLCPQWGQPAWRGWRRPARGAPCSSSNSMYSETETSLHPSYEVSMLVLQCTAPITCASRPRLQCEPSQKFDCLTCKAHSQLHVKQGLSAELAHSWHCPELQLCLLFLSTVLFSLSVYCAVVSKLQAIAHTNASLSGLTITVHVAKGKTHEWYCFCSPCSNVGTCLPAWVYAQHDQCKHQQLV